MTDCAKKSPQINIAKAHWPLIFFEMYITRASPETAQIGDIVNLSYTTYTRVLF